MSKRKLDEADWLEEIDDDFGDNDDVPPDPDEIDNEVTCIDLQMDEIGETSSELEKANAYQADSGLALYNINIS